MNLVNLKGSTLNAAIEQARSDDKVYRLHFLSSLTADQNTGRVDSHTPLPASSAGEFSDAKGVKDTKNKDKKKSAGKGNQDGNKNYRDDNSRYSIVRATRKDISLKFRVGKKLFCYGYQKPQGCTNKGCKYVHLCAYCEAQRTVHQQSEPTSDSLQTRWMRKRLRHRLCQGRNFVIRRRTEYTMCKVRSFVALLHTPSVLDYQPKRETASSHHTDYELVL